MILRKVIIDGKEMFIPISKEEALQLYKDEELIFSSDDEKKAFYDEVEDLEDAVDPDEVIDDRPKNLDEKVRQFSNKIEDALNKAFDQTKESFKSFGKMFENSNKKKMNNIVAILPFMDEEDIHELVEHILNDDEGYKDLPLVTVFPFLETKDCDRIFLKTIENKKVIASLAPFVSSETLDKLVDEYIAGKVQVDNIDVLYQFLSKESIRKVFNHLMK